MRLFRLNWEVTVFRGWHYLGLGIIRHAYPGNQYGPAGWDLDIMVGPVQFTVNLAW